MNYKFKPSHIVPAYLFIVAVLYGGSKPPASTNTPPDSISGDSTNSIPDDASSPTNQPPPVLMASRPRLVLSAPPQTQTETEPSTIHNSSFILQNSWNKRGAYCDWVHITFPDGFAFPSGTNLLTGVTVMAYGEIRENLHCSPSTSPFALPTRVSLVPGESSCVYGLTPSNTFLFAWQNVCVNRSPTNRVDASIELFDSGACSVRFDTVETVYPAQPPEGFVGQGQDAAWLAATFSPTDYAAITNKGYARWLDEDYVGYNEENGHCRGTVTVHSMPPNDEPCYLVCGPYKVIVTEPGDYSFPLEVFNEYTVRTYPTAMPLSISYDEGYYPDEDDYGLLMSPSNQSGPLLLGASSPTVLTARMIPSLHLLPSVIPIEQAANTCIRLWCNMRHVAWRFESLVSIGFMVTFDSRNIARITDAVTTYGAEGIIYDDGHPEVCAHISLIPSCHPWPWPHEPDPTNGCDTGGSDTNNTSNGQIP